MTVLLFAQAPVPTTLDPLTQGTGLRDQFLTAMKRCGVEPAFVPKVAILSSPSLVSFNPDNQTVRISLWKDLPPPIQSTVTAWAAYSDLKLSPEDQFREIFNSLLVPHELGHALQIGSGRLARMSKWDAEVEANKFAIAFFSLDRADRSRIERRVTNFTGFLGTLPSPVPKGQSPAAYFEQNYRALGSDPNAYGWYQGAFMRTAWQDRADYTFCSLVKRNAPQK